MSTIKIKSREEILEMLSDYHDWDSRESVFGIMWLHRRKSTMFVEPMFKYCGCRIPVEDRQNGYSKFQGYDFSDKLEKFSWLKEWVDRR